MITHAVAPRVLLTILCVAKQSWQHAGSAGGSPAARAV